MNRADSDRTQAVVASASPRLATAANALTGARLVCAPLIAAAIVHGPRHALLAGMVFALAVASDLADGRVARARGEQSALGGLLDHATDALFASVGLAALVWRGAIPAPLPALVALSFTQYALDSKALAGRPLRASSLGRWNGIAYFVALGIPVVRDALGLAWPPDALARSFGWVLIATTLVSMTDRAAALWRSQRRS